MKQRLLLTSDGTHTIGDDVILRASRGTADTGILIKRLTEISTWFGGADNASSICIDTAGMMQFPSSGGWMETIEVWDPFGELLIPLTVANSESQPSQHDAWPPRRNSALSRKKTGARKVFYAKAVIEFLPVRRRLR